MKPKHLKITKPKPKLYEAKDVFGPCDMSVLNRQLWQIFLGPFWCSWLVEEKTSVRCSSIAPNLVVGTHRATAIWLISMSRANKSVMDWLTDWQKQCIGSKKITRSKKITTNFYFEVCICESHFDRLGQWINGTFKIYRDESVIAIDGQWLIHMECIPQHFQYHFVETVNWLHGRGHNFCMQKSRMPLAGLVYLFL